MIVRCVSYASFINTIALLLSHERFFLLLLESFALMKLSPLEVDRELYAWKTKCDDTTFSFPAPLEVDRYLYFGWVFDCEGIEVEGFRPLSR